MRQYVSNFQRGFTLPQLIVALAGIVGLAALTYLAYPYLTYRRAEQPKPAVRILEAPKPPVVIVEPARPEISAAPSRPAAPITPEKAKALLSPDTANRMSRSAHDLAAKYMNSQYGETVGKAYLDEIRRGEVEYSWPTDMKKGPAVAFYREGNICGRVYFDRQNRATYVEPVKWCDKHYRTQALKEQAKQKAESARKQVGKAAEKLREPFSGRARK